MNYYTPPYSGYTMPQYNNAPTYPNAAQNGLQAAQEAFICRPVTSREEAIASPSDFMRPVLMPDIGHGTVYLKRFNPNTGASDILEFRLYQPEQAPRYVTWEELEAFKEELTKKPRRKAADDE